MKIKISFFLSLFFLIHIYKEVNAITLVYNMKIRRSFKIGDLFAKNKKILWILSGVPVIYSRHRTIVDPDVPVSVHERRKSGGLLLNLRAVSSKGWWAEASTGIEKEGGVTKGTLTFCKTRRGFDDIVLAAGRNFFLDKKSQFVLYGLTGFPTKREVDSLELFDTFVGTRFFSVGVGSEFSHAFIHERMRSCIGIFQNRFLHFFKRRWFPILPQDAFIQPGDVIDLLFALNYREKRNIFEIGYNPTYFVNQAVILPTEKIAGERFVRRSIYGSYTHVWKEFPFLKIPLLLGVGINRGWSNRFDVQIWIAWLNMSTVF